MSEESRDYSTDPSLTGNSSIARPGLQLRTAREQKGMSVEAAAKELYLAVRMVKALEADAYKDLPEPAFVRGYIRRYAQLLALSADELVQAFDHSYSADLETPPLQARLVNPVKELGNFKRTGIQKKGWLIAGIVFVLVAIILVAGLITSRSTSSLDASSALPTDPVVMPVSPSVTQEAVVAPATATPAPVVVPAPVLTPATQTAAAPAASPSGEPALTPSAAIGNTADQGQGSAVRPSLPSLPEPQPAANPADARP